MKKTNKLIGFLACFFCLLLNSIFGITITPPANPPPPPASGINLPFVFVNDSGLPASEVFVVGVGQNPDQSVNIGYSAMVVGSDGVVTLEYFAGPEVVAEPVSLSQLPQSDGNYVLYLPYTISGVFFVSLEKGISIPGASPGNFVGPNFSNCPPCTTESCTDCSTVFDSFEFTYQAAGPQVTINPTAVNFFGIPLYAYLSTATAPSLSNIGLYQPRDYVLGYIKSVFNSFPTPENQQWLNLFLLNNNADSQFNYLRILNPSLGMVGLNAIMDPQYLDNAAAYGFSFLDYMWTNPASYYRTTPLNIDLVQGIGTGESYVGEILPSNRFKFTSSPSGYVVVLNAPHKAIYRPKFSQNSTTEEIFVGNISIATDTSPNQVDGIQIAKLISEAIMAGVLPNPTTLPNALSDPFVHSFFPFYKNSAYLPTIGQTTGPWYNGYSQALHALGNIYTYAYDDSNALWGASCASSSATFETNPLTYVGITVGQCTRFITAAVSVTSSSNPSVELTSTTFTATVVGTKPGTPPTGTVQFTVNGVNSGAPQPLVNGTASLSISTLTEGTYKIGATYSGDSTYPSISSAPINQVVLSSTAYTTTTSVRSLLNPSQEGQEVVFIAVVDSGSSVATPTGVVTFLVNGTPVKTKSLGTYGRAAYATATLPVGTNAIDVHYSGDANFLPSISTTLSQVVVASAKTPTTTVVSSSNNPAEFGTPIIFTAIVEGSFGEPQGQVAFFVDGVRYSANTTDGIATLTLSNLSVGQHQIFAKYLGDQFNLPSFSEPLAQVVTPAIYRVNPPTQLRVNQVKNKFATQIDRINIVSWKPPVSGPRPVFYKIYSDALLQNEINLVRSPIKDILSLERNRIAVEEHNCKKGRTYHYFIVSVDALGRESVPAEVTFRP